MEGVAAMMAAEVASMPTTEMPMSADVPTAMPAAGEGDRPADHQHDDEDNRPENHPALRLTFATHPHKPSISAV
jgi:hypothetical protein